MVDLDGSVKGRGVNTGAIASICNIPGIEVELGGGIRSAEDVDRAFDLGVSYVILGTVIATMPEEAKEIILEYSGRVGIGIDALKGFVAVRGWKEITRQNAIALAREFEPARPAFLVYTDIDRDGMLTGPNIEATAEMVRSVKIPVVASGRRSCCCW